MTEDKTYTWTEGATYTTRDGTTAICIRSWEDGRACFNSPATDGAWIVDEDGRSVLRLGWADIVDGPEATAEECEEQEHEEYLAEGAQLEKDVKVEMDCYKEGHRQGLLDALAAILAQRDRLNSCELMEVIGEIASLGPYDSAAPF